MWMVVLVGSGVGGGDIIESFENYGFRNFKDKRLQTVIQKDSQMNLKIPRKYVKTQLID